MPTRYLFVLAALASSAIVLAGCSGTASTDAIALKPPQPESSDLPLPPSGPAEARFAATFSGVTVPGNPAYDSANATPDGGNLQLESGDLPSNLTAWAIYQLPESPGDPVDMVTVNAQYLDPDPVIQRPEEGYWTAYADYASDTWVFSGPHTTLQTRVSIPPEANAVSPGGFHYILVLVCQSNKAVVQQVQVGGYDGMGYEGYILGRPQGHSEGYACDIQLDPAGEPQIAYEDRPVLTTEEGSTLRVAKKNGDSWEIQSAAPTIEPNWFSFAIGDDGRRALLISDNGSTNLWLYYDNNTGEFSDAQLISNTYDSNVQGSVTFVNSADDSTQPLDQAVVVYAKSAPPDISTFSRTYDGLVLTPDIPVYGLSDEADRILVTTNADKLAVVGVPDKIAGDWYCAVGIYSAGAWDFLSVPNWGPLDQFEDSESNTPDAVVRESPTGDLVGCYMRNGRSTVGMARYNGVSWLSTDTDILAASVRDNIDIGAFGSGRTVILMSYGNMKPMLRWGLAGSGEAYSQQFLEAEPFAAISDSLAIDSSNNTHIATYSGFSGELKYYLRPASGPVSVETVDTGGLQLGGSRLFAQTTYVGDHLHLFYSDNAHPAVLHSENVNGVWTVENEIIDSQGLPYYIVGAGYLENSNLLYVCYLDYFSMQFRLVTGTPDEDDWQSQQFGSAFGELAFIADDETNVGLLGPHPNPLTDYELSFYIGPPRSGQPAEETVSADPDMFDLHAALAYSPADGAWGFVTTFSPNSEADYFRRNVADNWTGPYAVAQMTGPGSAIHAEGLSYLEADGTPRVVVLQQASGDPEVKTVVYTASPGGTNFSFLLKIKGLSDAVADMPYATAVPGPDGEPVVAIIHKLIAESTYDIDMFVPDGPGSWTLHETWDSPLSQFYPRLALAPDDQPAVVAIENDDASPLFGSVVAYYPW